MAAAASKNRQQLIASAERVTLMRASAVYSGWMLEGNGVFRLAAVGNARAAAARAHSSQWERKETVRGADADQR